MADQSNNLGAVSLDHSKTVIYSRFLRSCSPSRPLENSSSLSYLLSMTRGQRIIKALLNKGVTKSEIMRHCSVDFKTVHAWSKEWWHPSINNVNKLQALYIKHQNFPFGQLELNLEDYSK